MSNFCNNHWKWLHLVLNAQIRLVYDHTSEILKLESETVCSERFIVFLSTVLQRDSIVRKGADIKRLLSKRQDMWNNNQFDQLLSEFERCVKSTKRNSKRNMSSGLY